MKNIYIIVSLAIIGLLSSCDYNQTNFPELNSLTAPTNIVNYNYTLTATDYASIATAIKKPVNDSITLLKSQLVTAKANKSADSTSIQTSLNQLNNKLVNDSTMIAATAVGANKIFINNYQASKCIQSFLNTKYLYVDANSSATVNYNQGYDSINVVSADKLTFSTADYNAMGITTGLISFSGANDPNYMIPIYLKNVKFPYALKGTFKLIRYKYYSNMSTTQLVSVYFYDGTIWQNYSTASQVSKSFMFKGGKWLDLLIYKGLITGFTDFSIFSVKGDNQVWTWDNTYGAKMTGYSGGTLDNEDWLISPTIDLTNRSMAALTFNQTGKYFGTKANEATFWVSDNYNIGTSPASGSTWTQVTIPSYWTVDWTFASSGKISLNAFVGKKINFAFKYLSSPAASGTWEVNNVSVTEE